MNININNNIIKNSVILIITRTNTHLEIVRYNIILIYVNYIVLNNFD